MVVDSPVEADVGAETVFEVLSEDDDRSRGGGGRGRERELPESGILENSGISPGK
jgi:hypothetical protein